MVRPKLAFCSIAVVSSNHYFRSMNTNYLQTPVTYLKGVGPNRSEILHSELGIVTYQDLINLFPNSFIYKTSYYIINDLQIGNAVVQLIG